MELVRQILGTFLKDSDYQLLKDEGHSLNDIAHQLSIYETGIPRINLAKAATINDGIKFILDQEVENYVRLFESKIKDKSLIKFVPSSGAASRMFKELLQFLQTNKNSSISDLKAKSVVDRNSASVLAFISNIKKFAFYSDINSAAEKKLGSIDSLIANGKINELISFVISTEGLNYASLPKGEIKFHNYPGGGRTAFEEHFIEGIQYAKNYSGELNIHFTIPDGLLNHLNDLFAGYKIRYESDQLRFNISTSYQKKSTDTLAVDLENRPFRDSDGKLFFRPGGHGALLDNLNDLNEDIIFIKNIDNISPEYFHSRDAKYKKLLAGILLETQDKIFSAISKIESKRFSPEELKSIEKFSEEVLFIKLPLSCKHLDIYSRANYLLSKLNRPLRVCGMVLNEGQPGGGPFWVKEEDGSESLQIIEAAQVDLTNPEQKQIFNSSTHFNPVDIICSIKDYRGNKFDLKKYLNPATGLIAFKSKNGHELKSLELPGLWNGSMHFWNTIFVEVPKFTFNPVKEVNDLLKAEHQPMLK